MVIRAIRFGPSDRGVISSVSNPWGKVPLTAGGTSLTGRARAYMNQLLQQRHAEDPVSRRHHYVPKAYLRQWSADNKRIWALDTVDRTVRLLGLRDVCVRENFYRVTGADDIAHNRVELLFSVVDAELRRVQILFDQLQDPATLNFDDLIGLGVSVVVQRMRTLQQRRLRQQHNAWIIARNPSFTSIENDPDDPRRLAGFHTKILFEAMWEAADVMTTRQIELWHDPAGRFLTCDAPVLNPFIRNVRPSLVSATSIIWPVSPHRAVVLSNKLRGQKAVIRQATGEFVGIARQAVEQGRERMIFASEDQRDRLPTKKNFRRRTQLWMRCSDHAPNGETLRRPACCVELREAFASSPDVVLCHQGLHSAAPRHGALPLTLTPCRTGQ